MRLTDKQINRMLRDLERLKTRREEKRRRNRIKRAEERKKRWREKQKEKRAAQEGKILCPDWFKPYAGKYKAYIRFDVYKGFEHVLDYSFEEFRDKFINAKCHYCGINEGLGLDRIDNNLGHTKANTLVACGECNIIRRNKYTVQQMIEIGKILKSFRAN